MLETAGGPLPADGLLHVIEQCGVGRGNVPILSTKMPRSADLPFAEILHSSGQIPIPHHDRVPLGAAHALPITVEFVLGLENLTRESSGIQSCTEIFDVVIRVVRFHAAAGGRREVRQNKDREQCAGSYGFLSHSSMLTHSGEYENQFKPAGQEGTRSVAENRWKA